MSNDAEERIAAKNVNEVVASGVISEIFNWLSCDIHKRGFRNWEFHCITPLHHIIYLFALINFMDQCGRVVDQTHRRLPRHARATHPVTPVLPSLAVNTHACLVNLQYVMSRK
jgi:hypothetical protein